MEQSHAAGGGWLADNIRASDAEVSRRRVSRGEPVSRSKRESSGRARKVTVRETFSKHS